MGPPQKSAKGRALKGKADEAFAAQKWKKALDLYGEASEHLLPDPRIAQRMGDLSRRLKMDTEASDHYRAAAKFYANDGFWAKAIAINKMILEIDPNDVSVQRHIAEMYSAQGVKSRASAPSADAYARTEPSRGVSLAEEAPRIDSGTFDPASYGLIGGTLSIAGEEPRNETAPLSPMGESILGSSPYDETTVPEMMLGAPVGGGFSVPLFSALSPDELFAVMGRLAVRRLPAQALVCEEGDAGGSMYVISEGLAEVFTRDRDGSRLTLTELHGGEFFGEFGLLTNRQRNASVQAKTELELLEITSADLDFIATKHPRIWVVLEDYLRQRVIDTILKKSDVFRALLDEERQELAKVMSPKKMKTGEVVMTAGTDGDEMYFIKSGHLTVMVGSGNPVVGELSAGEYFGEVAMLTGKPRSATIRARTDCELFVLSRRDAAKVLSRNREILVRLRKKIEERNQETKEVYRSFEEARKTLELV